MLENIALVILGYLIGYFWHSHVYPWLTKRKERLSDKDRTTW